MERLRKIIPDYLKVLNERTKTTRVSKPYQLIGLYLAELLEDDGHKALYIKLAKTCDNQQLIELAKNITERKEIKNKGAYFMKVWHQRQK